MTQRRGERTARANERDFPYAVELRVPLFGFGKTIDGIYEFHRKRGLGPHRGRGQRRDDQDFVRWCFETEIDARDFSSAFDGKLM
jgi:hypothetical protein